MLGFSLFELPVAARWYCQFSGPTTTGRPSVGPPSQKEKMKIFKIEGKTTKYCRKIKEKMKMFKIEGKTTKYCRRIKEKV